MFRPLKSKLFEQVGEARFMKVLMLASGLGTICRGYERFVLDMATQLRSNGLRVRCWGTSNAPDVQALPILGREELQRLALERMRQDPDFASYSGSDLHDWTLHTEDQLFGLAAAARLHRETRTNEPLIVYVKWQGGLMDAGGKSTALLEGLARASREGPVHTVIHTDWVYPPVISRLASAGCAFHSIAPWVTKQLLELGITQGFELPMGTMSIPLKNVRTRQAAFRQTRGIPEHAFVTLTVGAFNNEIKNFPYLVNDLAPLAKDEDFYWVVAGARGKEPAAWEKQARSLFGPRFIPLMDVPFEQMPDVYGLADLALHGTLNETFGLCYLESQLAGLPSVMHDYHVTQWLTTGLPEELATISRVNMRVPGAALAAVAEWRHLLADTSGKASILQIMEYFRTVQEQRFAWENLGPRFAESFRQLAQPKVVKQPIPAPAAQDQRQLMSVLAKQQQPHKKQG